MHPTTSRRLQAPPALGRLAKLTTVALLAAAGMAVAPVAVAQKTDQAAATRKAGSDDRPIRNLLAAAQRLRDSIQAMAQAPAGENRAAAVRRGNEALLEVHRAMAALPPSLLLAQTNETDYQKAMDGAKQAAQRLRNAAQSLADESAGPKRNEAIRQVNEALLETQQFMADIAMAR